jgi:glucose-1-phosphate thymidylyltransferase
MIKRKGIILAGGSGTRLYPLTISVSKQLLPIYDKPMIFYPLSVLLLAGITDVLIITTNEDQQQFHTLLGDGRQWGINLTYSVQKHPEGIAQAFTIGKNFLAEDSAMLILGDNIFYGHGLEGLLTKSVANLHGACIFGHKVRDPQRYGVLGFDQAGEISSITEKPTKPASRYAITGMYLVDGTAADRCKYIKPSERGELEITSLLQSYLSEKSLSFELMGRGFAWFDTGTHSSLFDAGTFVKTVTERQGVQLGSPDEIAFRLGLIDAEQLVKNSERYRGNDYGQYLLDLVVAIG